jgi:hypothetical protein
VYVVNKWGERIFDDDDAANFSYQIDDLGEEGRSACLRVALEKVVSKAHSLGGLDDVNAVVAAALVARELEGGDDFKSVIGGPSNPIPPPTRELVEIAERAVLVLLDERPRNGWSFGYDLDGRSFRSMLRELQTVLAAALSGNPAALW